MSTIKKHRLNLLSFLAFRCQPPWLVVFEALILVELIRWTNYSIGWEYSTFLLYSLPITLIVWQTDRQLGFAFAILCTVAWWGVHMESTPYQTGLGFTLAVIGRLIYFLVLVFALDAVKIQRLHDLARIESLERAQKLERDILWASEREQRRIGRDLHDSLGPHLAAIGYAAAFLAKELGQRDQPEAAKAEQIHTMAVDGASLLRDLIQGVFPQHMDDFSLAIALEEFAGTTTRLSELSVSFFETGNPFISDPEQGMQLYRIVQEAVNNAAKHGNAKKVAIVLSSSENTLHLTVTDDGKGMALCTNGSRGMGLASMRYRARALGGDLKIESNPNEGTTIFCEIPNPPLLPTKSFL